MLLPTAAAAIIPVVVAASAVPPPYPPPPPGYPTAHASCLANAAYLSKSPAIVQGTHGWERPLDVLNVSLGGGVYAPMAVLTGIGKPSPYIHDAVSNALLNHKHWELSDLEEVSAAANTTLPSVGTALDIGAQLGWHSLALASRGYNVIAVEPLLHHALALEASACLNQHAWGGEKRITVVQNAALSPEQASSMSCGVLSPFRANDHGAGELLCKNGTGNSATLCGGHNFTFYHHYRRFCQALTQRLTLDELLLDGDTLAERPSALSIAKIDTSGSECDVLAGGTRSLFHRLRPRLILVNVDSPKSDACVSSLAAAHGYALHPLSIAPSAAVAKGTWRHSKHVVLSDTRSASKRAGSEGESRGGAA